MINVNELMNQLFGELETCVSNEIEIDIALEANGMNSGVSFIPESVDYDQRGRIEIVGANTNVAFEESYFGKGMYEPNYKEYKFDFRTGGFLLVTICE